LEIVQRQEVKDEEQCEAQARGARAACFDLVFRTLRTSRLNKRLRSYLEKNPAGER